jgi:hypothetical protein
MPVSILLPARFRQKGKEREPNDHQEGDEADNEFMQDDNGESEDILQTVCYCTLHHPYLLVTETRNHSPSNGEASSSIEELASSFRTDGHQSTSNWIANFPSFSAITRTCHMTHDYFCRCLVEILVHSTILEWTQLV